MDIKIIWISQIFSFQFQSDFHLHNKFVSTNQVSSFYYQKSLQQDLVYFDLRARSIRHFYPNRQRGQQQNSRTFWLAVATITFTGKNPCGHEIETTIEVTVRPLLKLQTCAVQLRPLLILVVTSAISRFRGQTALHCACCFAQAQ